MKLDQIRKVAVVGAGLMGHSIAQAFAQEGFHVNVTDSSSSALEVVKDRVRANLATLVEEQYLDQDEAERTLERISIFNRLDETIKEADFITEVVFEDLEIKKNLFQEMERCCSANVILASNTSSYRMTDIASLMTGAERAIITHWFNPPHLVPLVEVVPGDKTSEETYAITDQLLRKIKKVPVRVRKEIPGFLINRIQTALHREMYSLLEMGAASAEDLDVAVKASLGFRLASIGPLLVRDLAGLDVLYRVESWLLKEIDSSIEVNSVLRDMVARGELGVKTGRGFFQFTPESVQKIIKERDTQFVHRLKELYSG